MTGTNSDPARDSSLPQEAVAPAESVEQRLARMEHKLDAVVRLLEKLVGQGALEKRIPWE